MSGAGGAPGRRLDGVDGLRALAALSILVYHCWLYTSPTGHPVGGRISQLLLPNLALGVTLFFTLSGFLLWRPFAGALLADEPRPRTLPYLRNRALRILPAYWVVLAICALALGAAIVRRSATTIALGPLHSAAGLLATGTLTQNLFPAQSEQGLGPAWSLSVEVCFYLALPLLALAAFAVSRRMSTAKGRRFAALLPAGLLLVIGLSGKLVSEHLHHLPLGASNPADAGGLFAPADWHTLIMIGPWGQADLFAFGVALAVVEAEVATGRLRLPAHWRRLALAAAALIALPALVLVRHQQLATDPANTALAAVFALLLALLVLEPGPSRTRRVLTWRPLALVGLASFSVFLWNDPVARLLEHHGLTLGGPGVLVNLALVAAVVALLAGLTYRFVERPALALKSRRGPADPRSGEVSAAREDSAPAAASPAPM